MTRVEAYRILGILWGNTSSEEERAALSMAQNDLEFVDLMPDDVVVVTRCRDCEHAERYERTDGLAGYYCGHPQNSFTYGERWDRVFKPVKEANDFCSYGERRDDGKRGNDTGD